MKYSATKSLVFLLAALFFALLAGCQTGIESTRTIKMSRADQRIAAQTPEEIFASQISSAPLAEWQIGKRFLVADNKASMLLEFKTKAGFQRPDSIAGKILEYAGFDIRTTPGGDNVAVIAFSAPEGIYLYNTEKNADKIKEITGTDLPMLIDLDLVASADNQLRGKKLWTLSSLWYYADANFLKGRKFVPVSISSVTPGNMLFPFNVEFIDDTGRHAYMYMNVSGASGLGAESRTFPSLFSLSDPKLKYPSISPEVWELVCNGEVKQGMTKDECRLALGNPSDVDAGHNWNNVIDVWRYRDGSFLQFQDGLLINFRH